MRRKSITLLLWMAMFCFPGCSDGDDNDGTIQIIQGEVSSIQLSLLNNGGATPSVNEDKEYPKGAFMLAINVKTNATSWTGNGSTVVDLGDPIKDIRIFSLHPFNDSYPENSSNISSLFRQYPLYVVNNLDDTLERGKLVERIHYVNGFFYKALLTEPTPGINQLKVEIELQSGKKFIAETEEFTFI